MLTSKLKEGIIILNNIKENSEKMDIKKCYQAFGGDYEDVFVRLSSDERIERFVKKFVELDDCGQMLAALEQNDYRTMFLKAHDLKGTSSNLGFTALYASSFELCEALRAGQPSRDISPLVEAVKSDCEKIAQAVKQFDT